MNKKDDIPAPMNGCERIETIELAVIRQARVRVWLAEGEVFEGRASTLETRGGIDWLTVDERQLDASSVATLLIL